MSYDLAATVANIRRPLRISKQIFDSGAEFHRIVHGDRRAMLLKLIGNVLRVVEVRTGDYGLTNGSGLEQVMAADRHKCASNKSDVTRRIEKGYLAHCVAEEYLDVGRAWHPVRT